VVLPAAVEVDQHRQQVRTSTPQEDRAANQPKERIMFLPAGFSYRIAAVNPPPQRRQRQRH